MQSPRIQPLAIRIAGLIAAAIVLVAGLTFAPVALAGTHSGPTATTANASTVRLPLRRGPGVYMVRVTVSGAGAGENRVNVRINSIRPRVLTVKKGRGATLQLPVRVRGRFLTIRAVGRRARPTVKVLKWLMASLKVAAPPGTAVPITPPRKLPGASVKPRAHRGGADKVAVRIPHPGIYVVHVAIHSRAAICNRVRLQIGGLARSEVTNRRGRAVLSLKMRLAKPMLTVRARSSRATPEISLSLRSLAVVKSAKPKSQPAAVSTPTPAPAPSSSAAPSDSSSLVFPQAQPASTGPLGVPGSWNLIFDDEFNAPQWGTVWSQMRASNWAMNNVTTEASDANVSGGTLQLTLSDSSHGGYVSTCSTDDGGGFTMGYGYAEARIQLPVSNGQLVGWPAWWIVGSNWPAGGEADILEGLGGTATSNYHSNNGTDNSGAIPGNWYDGGWHTYGVDREPGQNTIYWDGKEVRTYKTYDNGAPQCLILNIGSGSGPTVNGAVMQVDYVRVWSH